jgi:hypothetical protein
MLIKQLSFEEQGRHYGYPECCISAFYRDNTNLKLRQEKYQFVYGFLPCSNCYEKLENGLDINDLMINRKCINSFTSKREDILNYYDPISQSQIFLTELELLMKKTHMLSKLPYDNVATWEQIQYLINPKRMHRKKVSEDRVTTSHSIKNICRLLKLNKWAFSMRKGVI